MPNPPSFARAWRARHRPAVRWTVLAVIALLAIVRSESIVTGAHRARAAWGRVEPVLVAARDIAPGTVIGPDDVRSVARPADAVPSDATADVVGRTATSELAAGEVMLDRRLSRGGTGPTALLGSDDVAFAVPVDAATPSLRIGDRVDVFAPVDSASRSAVGATRVAHRAVVAAIGDRSVTIAVDAGAAAVVARSLLGASVVLALVN